MVGESERLAPLGHRRGIDGLRAVAVTLVVAYHLWPRTVVGGYLGVDVFFVLSGYLITRLALTESATTDRVGLLAFWRRRIRRLAPAFLACVAGAGVVAMVLADTNERVASIRSDAMWSLTHLVNWHFAFGGQSYFDAFAEPSPLRHLWSLAVEEQMYVIWPIVMAVVVRSTARRGSHAARHEVWIGLSAAALASASATWMIVLVACDPSAMARAYDGTDTRAFAILIGAAAAAISVRSRSGGQAALLVRRTVVVASVVFLAVAAGIAHENDVWMYRGGFLAASVAAAVVVSVSAGDNRVSAVLGWRPLVVIGGLSYSIYLWHWPVIVLMTDGRLGLNGLVLDVVRIAVTTALAVVSTRLVERPIRTGRVVAGSTFTTWIVGLGAAALVVASVALVTSPGSDTDVPAEASLLPTADAVADLQTTSGLTSIDSRTPGVAQSTEVEVPLRPTRVLIVSSNAVVGDVVRSTEGTRVARASREACPLIAVASIRLSSGPVSTGECIDGRTSIAAAIRPDAVVIGFSSVDRLPFSLNGEPLWSDDPGFPLVRIAEVAVAFKELLAEADALGVPVAVVDTYQRPFGMPDDRNGVETSAAAGILASKNLRSVELDHLAEWLGSVRSPEPAPAGRSDDRLRVLVIGDSTSFPYAKGLVDHGGDRVAVKWVGREGCVLPPVDLVRWWPGTELSGAECPGAESWSTGADEIDADVVVALSTLGEQAEQRYPGSTDWHLAGDSDFAAAHEAVIDDLLARLAESGALVLIADAPPFGADSSNGFGTSPMARESRRLAWQAEIDRLAARSYAVGELPYAATILDIEAEGHAARPDSVHLSAEAVALLGDRWVDELMAAVSSLQAQARAAGCQVPDGNGGVRLELDACAVAGD